MARHESEREDLLREAAALRERVELELPGGGATVVAGFRDSGALSVYFGGDTAIHFDESRRVRRAFCDGLLYRSQGQTLAQLTRVRTEAATELRRHDLLPDELHAFLERLRCSLQSLVDALQAGTARCVASVPPQSDLRPRLLAFLQAAIEPGLQLSPPIKR